MFTYYSTQRPIGPGTYPKPHGNFPYEIMNFEFKMFIQSIGRTAFGKLVYIIPLSEQDVQDYELVKGEEDEERLP